MSEKVLEIRWHGRGGQGAKTAALMLAETVAQMGKYVQGFPEYGPERMGAPILAFNRISDEPIHIHSNVINPDIVIVLDATLLGEKVTAGVPEDGIYIVNTTKTPQEVRKKLNIKGGKIFTVDANQISLDTIGRVIPNTPLMGAFVKATGLMSYDEFIENVKGELEKKFKTKPEVIAGNIKAIERAYQEVKGE
ncbi:Pyruvate synthase subunit PorC [Tepidanaerobacter acetatoxydans Re1]|uniref:Pyruvate synthase subunit PorC n=1 Tax=Tepidanaerobacter acetatoxydans (strain DSM 21804 / JCM 16047 / Re1) TaxID=1209989 RepID=F4LRY6_TEPAE|nr:2-oxoacid:acceptor oxidoreductase family protein [Tepidanaerobacter acetatoxydans]AEE92325.1 pyruvate/ketoisovalerate oxidoreductase, gamma subunit [Tepidanaerobacter acetatoxydans Re1]CCP27213.1 Pyruvate synthase subunit PorC [Tepidanaerobacter acetatoxydans Re1]